MENKYTKTQALKIIIANAKIYKSNLLNKQLCFLYVNKKTRKMSFCTVGFHDYNYLHFVGVDTKHKASKFFEKACNNTLTMQDFEFKDEFTTFKKYNIISSAMQITYNAKMIGEFGNKGVKINADVGVGNVSYVMTIGKDEEGNFYPKGIIEDDIRLATYSASPIFAILSKNLGESSFKTVTYKSKNINIQKLHFPKEILQMLSPEAIQELRPDLYEKLMAQSNDKQPISNEKITEKVTYKEITEQETPSANKQDKAIAKSEAATTIERYENKEQQKTIPKRKSYAELKAEAMAIAEARNKALHSAPPTKTKNNNAPSLDD